MRQLEANVLPEAVGTVAGECSSDQARLGMSVTHAAPRWSLFPCLQQNPELWQSHKAHAPRRMALTSNRLLLAMVTGIESSSRTTLR